MSEKRKAGPWRPLNQAHCDKVVAEMCELADEYEESAECLCGRVGDFGHSVALLSVLALEVRLKCAVLIEKGYRPRGHDHVKLWQELLRSSRDQILADAIERYPNFDDTGEFVLEYGDIEVILHRLREVFERGRYSYEFNDRRTPEEMRELGERWIESGARPEDADLAFYPTQRDGLNFGLRNWLHVHSAGSRLNCDA